jgi:putative glutamine transport system substrate-binding protein
MKKIIYVLIAALTFALLGTGCARDYERTTADITERGQLIVGVKSDVPYFSYFDEASGTYKGYEIEIAELIAETLFGSRQNVEFIPITTRTRSVMLKGGDIDLVIASFTASEEREADFNFSHPYYTDHLGLLVRSDSDYRDIRDLEGKTVGVLQGSTSGNAVLEEAKRLDTEIKIITYASYDDIKDALLGGRCDAFCTDRAILRGYLTPELRLTPDEFSPQNYAVATKKENTELTVYINQLMELWAEDGTLEVLKSKYGI